MVFVRYFCRRTHLSSADWLPAAVFYDNPVQIEHSTLEVRYNGLQCILI